MAARSGMANLILQLRMFSNAGTADWTQAGQTFFSDDQLQTALDRHSAQLWHLSMPVYPQYVAGAINYQDYLWPEGVTEFVEEIGTDSTFAVRDVSGAVVDPTTYTALYSARRIQTKANTFGLMYFLDVNTFNMWAAAADVWRAKAGFVAANFDFKADGNAMSSSQEYKFYVEKAAEFDAKSGPKYGRFVRTDEAPNGTPGQPDKWFWWVSDVTRIK